MQNLKKYPLMPLNSGVSEIKVFIQFAIYFFVFFLI